MLQALQGSASSKCPKCPCSLFSPQVCRCESKLWHLALNCWASASWSLSSDGIVYSNVSEMQQCSWKYPYNPQPYATRGQDSPDWSGILRHRFWMFAGYRWTGCLLSMLSYMLYGNGVLSVSRLGRQRVWTPPPRTLQWHAHGISRGPQHGQTAFRYVVWSCNIVQAYALWSCNDRTANHRAALTVSLIIIVS